MRLAWTPEQEAFRQQVRGYLEGVMTPDLRARQGAHDLDPDTYREVVRRVGADGWLCLSWPTEYGGRGLSEIEEFILFDEAQRAGVPIPFLTTNTVGPTIMTYGTDEQRKKYLPGILEGRIHFSIGYSEPGAGTDLASLSTRAVREGDHYVVNGQKMWTSLIEHADFVWLAVQDQPRRRSVTGACRCSSSPPTRPGFSYTPVKTVGGGTTSATYYDHVHVLRRTSWARERGLAGSSRASSTTSACRCSPPRACSDQFAGDDGMGADEQAPRWSGG
jgi:3-oxocholest-4-en-26-oyl-CoA dehydrogenase alpha subunit